jgi:chaperonin cofactor prefoldin
VSTVNDLTNKKDAIKKRMAEVRSQLEPLSKRVEDLQEQLRFLEMDFRTACDDLREATK